MQAGSSSWTFLTDAGIQTHSEDLAGAIHVQEHGMRRGRGGNLLDCGAEARSAAHHHDQQRTTLCSGFGGGGGDEGAQVGAANRELDT
jgi:hypothetical protein